MTKNKLASSWNLEKLISSFKIQNFKTNLFSQLSKKFENLKIETLLLSTDNSLQFEKSRW